MTRVPLEQKTVGEAGETSRWVKKRSSLIVRVVLLSSVWVMLALFAISAVSVISYQNANKRNFEQLLTAHLYTLISGVYANREGILRGKPQLGDIRYSDPSSGWYWDVIPVSPELKGQLKSPSLGSNNIASPSEKDFPFNDQFIRMYPAKTLQGQDMQVIESDVVLGRDNYVARFRVMGNLADVRAEFHEFRVTLRWYLLTLGIASLVINALIIAFMLRPLSRIKRALGEIRTGKAQHIDTRLPIEVAPLAEEMNALIDNNQRIIERFRRQVGNLAHSLKTPLSVLVNEASRMQDHNGVLIREQTQNMRQQIDHYLQRARIAAQRDSVVYRTPVVPVIERLCRVMEKLNPNLAIAFSTEVNDLIFAGEREDIEEVIGNLLDNAAKWASKSIVVSLYRDESSLESREKNGPDFFIIFIEDDGPGLSEEERARALKRGLRLDESKPGTGLGLSIVAEMVQEYGGKLVLNKSKTGGLRVEVMLPLAAN